MSSGRDDLWPEIESWIAASGTGAAVVPAADEVGERVLAELELHTWSALGALARHAALITAGDGWVRVLGAGGSGVPVSLLDPFAGGGRPPMDERLVVGHDALGGVFAIDAGDRDVHYLAPDTLAWESLERGHADWLEWLLGGDLAGFYADEWAAWRDAAEGLAPDRGIHLHPPLWAQAETRSAKAVPVAELWSLALEHGEQLRDLPDGARVQIRFD